MPDIFVRFEANLEYLDSPQYQISHKYLYVGAALIQADRRTEGRTDKRTGMTRVIPVLFVTT
jgi:hypothetical protein